MEMPAAVEAPLRKRGLLAERRWPAWLVREAPLVAFLSLYAAVVVRLLPDVIRQDGWYALVAGREIVERGLPDRDHLTAWTYGQAWIDQPWASQAGFYLLHLAGGLALVLLVHAVFVVGAFALAVVAARRLGASPRSVLLVALPTALLSASAWDFRSQASTYPLFVAVLWLLAADSRRPSRRVFLVFPLLLVWANLHGSVVLGVLLVAVRGATYAAEQLRVSSRARRWWLRATVLVACPAACIFASPYGVALATYYLKRPSSPALAGVSVEWLPLTPSRGTALFYALALTAVWALGRYGRRLTLFEQTALAVAIVSPLVASRAVVWLPLAAVVILPVALEGHRRPRPRTARVGRRSAGYAAVAFLLALVSVFQAARQPAAAYEERWSAVGLGVVVDAARDDPDAQIFAASRYADWLLWKEPALAGRIAIDIRFGMLSETRLEQLLAYRNHVGGWKRVLRGVSIVVLDNRREADLVADLSRERGARVAYQDDDMTVILRAGAATR